MISRGPRLFVLVASVATTLALFAAPPAKNTNTPTNPNAQKLGTSNTVKPVAPANLGSLHPTIPVVPDRPGVHIVAVRVQGNCRQAATFAIDIQNNLRIVAHKGMVTIKAANGGTHSVNFENLRPAERRTLTLPTPWSLTCALSETGQPSCFEVTVGMEPDGTANGEVWDNVAHTVCTNPPRPGTNAPVVTDTQHKIPL